MPRHRRNLGRNLTTGNPYSQLFGNPSQTLQSVQSNPQGINYVLQQFLKGLGVNKDKEQREAMMEAVQAALVSDPETVTQSLDSSSFTGTLEGGEGDETEITSSNPNKRSLVERLTAAGEDLSGNPYMQQFQQSLIPGRLSADLAKTNLGERRDYAAGLATTKRQQQLTDIQTKQENAIKLKQTPATGFGTSRPAAPIQNYARRQQLVEQFGEASSQVRQFDTYVRANKIIDFGGSVGRFNPQAPGSPEAVGPKTIPLQSTVEHQRAVAVAKAEAQAGGAALKKAMQNQIDGLSKLTEAQQSANYMNGLLTQLAKSEGLPGMIGFPDSVSGAIYKVFGTPFMGTVEADFEARLSQIGGMQFLQAFQSLKGGGQITEAEGNKATEAMSRLQKTGQSEASYRKAIKDLRDVTQRAIIKARLGIRDAKAAEYWARQQLGGSSVPQAAPAIKLPPGFTVVP